MTSLKSKLMLLGIVSVAIGLVLIGLNFFSIQQGNRALSNVYEHQIVPASALQEIDSDLKEIRFRMAGVLLDVMPAVGSRNHLNEVRKRVPEQWALFKAVSNLGNISEDAKQDTRHNPGPAGAGPTCRLRHAHRSPPTPSPAAA